MIQRIFFIFLSFFLFFFQKQEIISQYRDHFTEKRKANALHSHLVYTSFFGVTKKNAPLIQILPRKFFAAKNLFNNLINVIRSLLSHKHQDMIALLLQGLG